MSARARSARGMRPEPIAWTPATAYAVGIAATDGNLGRDGRSVSLGSMDREQVETFLHCVGRLGARISEQEGPYFRTQLSDRSLHVFLTEAGLTPNKSLTLGALVVPEVLFWDLARGLLDGDGSILNYVHNPIKKTYPDYSYERLQVVFNTASRLHAEWIQEQFRRRGISSALLTTVRKTPEQSAARVLFVVRMGKHSSIAALASMYRDPSAPSLKRKWQKWDAFLKRYSRQEAIDEARGTLASRRSHAALDRAKSSDDRHLN